MTTVTVPPLRSPHSDRVMRGRWIIVPLAVFMIGSARPGGREIPAAAASESRPEEMRRMIESGRLEGLRWPDFSGLRPSLIRAYEAKVYSPLWLENDRLSDRANLTLHVLSEAAWKGLDREDYDVSLLTDWSSRRAEAMRFDLGLTVAVMRYASALHEGRIDPRQVRFALDQKDRLDTAAFLEKYLSLPNENVAELLAAIEPPFAGYRQLESRLGEYLQLAARPAADLPMPPRLPVRPGDPLPGVQALAARLALLGDLEDPSAAAAQPEIYSGRLVDAVKHLQERHGLASTGILDAPTYRALRTPLSQRILQMQLTLERWRWLPASVRPAIVINIPEFELRAWNEDRTLALRMHVIVGRAYRHRTPVFEDTLKSVIIRPYWNVPPSIQRNEILPALRRDPGYLVRHDMQPVDAKNRPADVRSPQELLSGLASGKIRLRQNPGPRNSLGLLKFHFPNAFDVYLHGTPAQQLFSRARRDFSHGCIRVEDPVSLATWVLRDVPDWNRERIVAAMAVSRTREIPVHREIAVLVLYGTAVAEDNGEVHFFDDLYGYDADLHKALARGYPYPAADRPPHSVSSRVSASPPRTARIPVDAP